MKLEKSAVHNWPEGKPEFYLAWYPTGKPTGIFWGPCASEFIRDDIARRILAVYNSMENESGPEILPDARYTGEKGLIDYL